jgi:type II secretion system protein L
MNPELLHIDEYLSASESSSESSEEGSERLISLWVNSDQISFHKAELPDAPKGKWPSLLPWILEDQLLVPVEDLHLVICSVNSDRVADVTSIPKTEMHRLQLLLESDSKQIQSLIPDVFALPLESDFITVAKLGDRLLVRSGQYQGFSGTPDFVWAALQLQQMQSLAQDSSMQQPLRIQCIGLATESVPDWAESLCVFNANPINWQFADVPAETNLFTGAFKAQRGVPSLSFWMPTFGIAALALVLICSWAVVDHVKAGRELMQINQQVLNEFEASFGEASSAVSNVQRDAAEILSQRELRYFTMANSVMDITQSLDAVISNCSDCDFSRLQISVDNATLNMSQNANALSRLSSMDGFTVSSTAPDESGQVQLEIRRGSP